MIDFGDKISRRCAWCLVVSNVEKGKGPGAEQEGDSLKTKVIKWIKIESIVTILEVRVPSIANVFAHAVHFRCLGSFVFGEHTHTQQLCA